LLVAELDERYFELQRRFECGGCSLTDVESAFSHARAASAIQFAAEGKAAEAVYESAIATDSLAELRPVVRAAALCF
jgi:hypothetical protein